MCVLSWREIRNSIHPYNVILAQWTLSILMRCYLLRNCASHTNTFILHTMFYSLLCSFTAWFMCVVCAMNIYVKYMLEFFARYDGRLYGKKVCACVGVLCVCSWIIYHKQFLHHLGKRQSRQASCTYAGETIATAVCIKKDKNITTNALFLCTHQILIGFFFLCRGFTLSQCNVGPI